MKAISHALKNHLSQEVATLCTLVKITRKDAVIVGLTDHDSNVIYDSVTYVASGSFTPRAVVSSAGLNVDHGEIEAVFSSDLIREEDVLAGLYDHAQVTLMLVNYTAPEDGVLVLRHGHWGEMSLRGGQFVAELRGLAQALQYEIGELYSPTCRAMLGDARCKVNLAAYTAASAVQSVEGALVFKDAARTEPAGFFAHGTLKFTSGDNAGWYGEVKAYVGGEVTLLIPPPQPMSAGDGYQIIAGCDKSFSTCRTRFSNGVNFRGEPHVPGLDRLFQPARRD